MIEPDVPIGKVGWADGNTREVRHSTKLTAVPESPLVQIATLAESMPGSIELCYGESDLPTPAFIINAANLAALGGHTFYTHTAGYRELRQAIADKVADLHSASYDDSEIMCTVGASMAIFAAVRACVGPGDNAVIVTPAYAIYSNAVTMFGGEPRSVQFDVDRIRDSIDDNTRMLIVNSPSNPTGTMLSVDDQRALLALADERGIRLLADDVYEHTTYDTPLAPSFARISEDKERLIVVNSFSKTYCMTGWRLGWAQASQSMIRAMTTGVEFMTSNATAPVRRILCILRSRRSDRFGIARCRYASRDGSRTCSRICVRPRRRRASSPMLRFERTDDRGKLRSPGGILLGDLLNAKSQAADADVRRRIRRRS